MRKHLTLAEILVAITCISLLAGLILPSLCNSTPSQTISDKGQFHCGEIVKVKLDGRKGMITKCYKNIGYEVKFVYDDTKQFGTTLGSASKSKEFYTVDFFKEFELEKEER